MQSIGNQGDPAEFRQCISNSGTELRQIGPQSRLATIEADRHHFPEQGIGVQARCLDGGNLIPLVLLPDITHLAF
jgi:hypothetical protein